MSSQYEEIKGRSPLSFVDSTTARNPGTAGLAALQPMSVHAVQKISRHQTLDRFRYGTH